MSEWNYKEERRNIKEDWIGRKIFDGDIVKSFFSSGEEWKLSQIIFDEMEELKKTTVK